MSFRDQIGALVRNRFLGSSELLHAILDFYRNASGIGAADLKWSVTALGEIDHSMVIVHHFLQCLTGVTPKQLPGTITQYESQWANSEYKVAEAFLQQFPIAGHNIITHSKSGTIMSLLGVAHLNGAKFEVIQTESDPGGEGVIQFNQLEELDIKTTLVQDEQIDVVVPQADMCVLGMDQYEEGTFINKVGSLHLSRVAVESGVPVYVLGDSRKKVDRLYLGSELFEVISFTEGMFLVTEQGVTQFGA